ncbi:MAG: penicillin-binding protein, partial [Novosphingobium meiothermophilum]
QGNLVGPARRPAAGSGDAGGAALPEGAAPDAPQAASDDFLNRATGKRETEAAGAGSGSGAATARPRPVPAPTPTRPVPVP